jgi:membrane protease YdiL (CAAX protease family)
MRRSLHPFRDGAGRLRNGWWIAVFFAVLTGLLLPLLLLSRAQGTEVPLHEQAGLVLVASLICQGLRRSPIGELLGPFDGRWPRQFLAGVLGGALLMAVPAMLLGVTGLVGWRSGGGASAAFWTGLVVLTAAAMTEELLFRGFLFQRLRDGLGPWSAQGLIAALFLLTHSDALRAAGALGLLAGANIFLASLLFGLAWLRTGSLAMPLGLHLAANITQGPVLGFGVSGHQVATLLTPELGRAPAWLDGGRFGLEASLPGLLCLIALLALLWRWRPTPAP